MAVYLGSFGKRLQVSGIKYKWRYISVPLRQLAASSAPRRFSSRSCDRHSPCIYTAIYTLYFIPPLSVQSNLLLAPRSLLLSLWKPPRAGYQFPLYFILYTTTRWVPISGCFRFIQAKPELLQGCLRLALQARHTVLIDAMQNLE